MADKFAKPYYSDSEDFCSGNQLRAESLERIKNNVQWCRLRRQSGTIASYMGPAEVFRNGNYDCNFFVITRFPRIAWDETNTGEIRLGCVINQWRQYGSSTVTQECVWTDPFVGGSSSTEYSAEYIQSDVAGDYDEWSKNSGPLNTEFVQHEPIMLSLPVTPEDNHDNAYGLCISKLQVTNVLPQGVTFFTHSKNADPVIELQGLDGLFKPGRRCIGYGETNHNITKLIGLTHPDETSAFNMTLSPLFQTCFPGSVYFSNVDTYEPLLKSSRLSTANKWVCRPKNIDGDDNNTLITCLAVAYVESSGLDTSGVKFTADNGDSWEWTSTGTFSGMIYGEIDIGSVMDKVKVECKAVDSAELKVRTVALFQLGSWEPPPS